MAIDATKSTIAPAAASPASSGGTSPLKGSNGGIGATADSMGSAVTSTSKKWVARGATSLYSILKWPFAFAYKLISTPAEWIRGKIWGKVQVTPTVIKVSVPGWIWGYDIKDVAPGYALSKGWITFAVAIEKGCNEEQLRSEARQPVKFNYLNWRRAEIPYDGSLRYALQHNYITIFEAIKQNFITKKQAIDGKWTTVEALAKADADAKAKKAAKGK